MDKKIDILRKLIEDYFNLLGKLPLEEAIKFIDKESAVKIIKMPLEENIFSYLLIDTQGNTLKIP